MVARKKPEKLLTDVELELMNLIWERGTCTVKDAQSALPKERDLAYTSVATIMKILEQKRHTEKRKVRARPHLHFSTFARRLCDCEPSSFGHERVSRRSKIDGHALAR